MSYKIAALPQTLIEPMWETVKPHLERVIELVADETTIEHIFDKALSGEVLIIVICKGVDIIAAMTADIRSYDTGLKALHIPQLGGDDFFEWRDQLDSVLFAIAKDFNCSQLRIVGRRGWVKALKDLGWEEQYVILKKDVGA
jgi:hypothetical protein